MKHLAALLALFLALALPVDTMAQTRVIGDLSNGALLGQIRDTAQLQNDFATHRPLLAQASLDLGLTSSDFNEVATDIARGRATYVQIPRHLSGMAGQHGGHTFAVHNIVIPQDVYGWEVDLERPTSTVRVFMPNRCGNISYLLIPKHHTVAATPYHATTPIAPPVAVAPSPAPTLAPEATPAAAVATAPLVPQAPEALAPAPPAPATHHFAVLPWLALGLIGVVFAHGVPSIKIPLPHHHCGCPHRS